MPRPREGPAKAADMPRVISSSARATAGRSRATAKATAAARMRASSGGGERGRRGILRERGTIDRSRTERNGSMKGDERPSHLFDDESVAGQEPRAYQPIARTT